MGVVQCGGDLFDQVGYPPQTELRFHYLFECARIFDIAHYDEAVITFLTKVIDGQNIGVVQASNSLGLAPEALAEAGLLGMDGRQDLHRHEPVQAGLVGFVDSGHATPADLRDDLVLSQSLPDETLQVDAPIWAGTSRLSRGHYEISSHVALHRKFPRKAGGYPLSDPQPPGQFAACFATSARLPKRDRLAWDLER